MLSDFIPVNELEQKLLQAQNGSLLIPTLIDTLVHSQVVALFNQELPANGTSTTAAPLALGGSSGAPMLAVFTSLARAKPMVEAHSSYRFALRVDFTWLLRGIATGVGLVVNPGWQVGLEMPPNSVAQLKRDVIPASPLAS